MTDLQDAVTLSAELAPMTLAEERLENAISIACAQISMATTSDQRRQAYEQMCFLCEQRTPAQIRRMELALGLCG